jgi:hypothetical protein
MWVGARPPCGAGRADHQHIALIVLGLLGAIFISIAFSRTRAAGASEITGHDPAALFLFSGTLPVCLSIAQVDADIGGDGIRIAIWTQICFLIAIAVLGTFHCKATGAKELGAGLAVTHFSLAVALLVQFGRGTLTPADAVIGAMILDAQNSALLIQLTTKMTLAARWQVGIIAACQATGLDCLHRSGVPAGASRGDSGRLRAVSVGVLVGFSAQLPLRRSRLGHGRVLAVLRLSKPPPFRRSFSRLSTRSSSISRRRATGP